MWVATVANIDWPSKPGLSTAAQKQEIHALLDRHQLNGFNAVFMQVRPSADAFYASKFEPWSQWISGKQGKAPDPYYDPLTFFIDACHRRGMEFHAWLNPYRAIVNADNTITDSLHITRMAPDWFLRYGDNVYFDPGIPEVRQYFVNVTMDILKRYDVDAIHFDDYFYPYKIDQVTFPDSLSYASYGSEFPLIDDWRRNNVDMLVKELSVSIQSAKPYVKFGISPFGVWRNKDKDPTGSATQAGQTNYDDLYADILKWLREDWIHYVVPQIYWHIGFERADYPVLVDWWRKNAFGKHVYIGQGAYRINGLNQSDPWKNPSQMPDQLRLNRSYDEIKGSVFFSSKSMLKNPLGISDSLRTNLYRYKALIPVMPYMKAAAPGVPDGLMYEKDHRGNLLSWSGVYDTALAYLVLYRFKGTTTGSFEDPSNILAILPAGSSFYVDASAGKGRYTYAITAVNRLHVESNPSQTITVKR